MKRKQLNSKLEAAKCHEDKRLNRTKVGPGTLGTEKKLVLNSVSEISFVENS